MIVSVCPNPCLDVYYYTGVLKEDDTNRVENPYLSPGGKGLNAARVITRLGENSHLITVLGGCIGRDVEEKLIQEGVQYKSVWINDTTRVDVVLEQKSKGTHILIAPKGPNLSDEEVDKLKRLILSVETDYMILGGSIPPSLRSTFYAEIISERPDVKVIVDADGELLRKAVEAKPFAIKPNRHELERLVGRPLFDINDIINASKEIIERGVSVVVSSLGRFGAIAVTKDGVFRAVPPHVEVANTIGAGDSLVGGFVYALNSGADIKEALRLGVACGSATVMEEGPKLCRKENVDELYKLVRLESIGKSSA